MIIKDTKSMGYWKSRVFPTIKKLFEKSPTKKSVAVVEASKSLTFDDSKVFRSIN